MTKKYRKKPVVIEAIQWTGNNYEEIVEFTGGICRPFPIDIGTITTSDSMHPGSRSLMIPTLEGIHEVSLNDFVIKGIKGEFYPCKPDIFDQTYEEVKE